MERTDGNDDPDWIPLAALHTFTAPVRRSHVAGVTRHLGAAGSSVKLVVLSGCYSGTQAEALCAPVDYVVGLRGTIDRAAARSFAIGFYGGLGERESVAAAYRQGCAAIGLEGLTDSDGPQLTVRDGIDAELVVLAGPRQRNAR